MTVVSEPFRDASSSSPQSEDADARSVDSGVLMNELDIGELKLHGKILGSPRGRFSALTVNLQDDPYWIVLLMLLLAPPAVSKKRSFFINTSGDYPALFKTSDPVFGADMLGKVVEDQFRSSLSSTSMSCSSYISTRAAGTA